MLEPTVFVVDDDAGVRKSLRALMSSAGLRTEVYAASSEFLDAYDAQRPGCLILDLRLGAGQDGLNLQDELRRQGSPLPIIVLTGHATVTASVRALKNGAFDFLRKPVVPKRLLERVREAIETDRQYREETARRTEVAERIASLTPRERQVMDLLLGGKTSKEVAVALEMSVRTAEGHRRRVLGKMGVSSAAHLVAMVLRGPVPAART